jgi:hypothetical protein
MGRTEAYPHCERAAKVIEDNPGTRVARVVHHHLGGGIKDEYGREGLEWCSTVLALAIVGGF